MELNKALIGLFPRVEIRRSNEKNSAFMIRSRLCSASDSPFRYGRNVRVAPHVLEKKYGEDVLLFASGSRLNSEALNVLGHAKDSIDARPKAFWEVFAKRANESIHLLPFGTLANIARCLELAPNVNLATGTCKVMSDFLSNEPSFDATRIVDLIALFAFLNKYLLDVDEKLFRNLLHMVENSIHLFESTSDVDLMVREISAMANRLKGKHPISDLLVQRLVRRRQSFNRLDSYTDSRRLYTNLCVKKLY